MLVTRARQQVKVCFRAYHVWEVRGQGVTVTHGHGRSGILCVCGIFERL